jgi:uncharacterized protein YqeY
MLRDDLNEALKTALKGRDQKSTSTLRMVLAALKDKDIAARPKGITQIPDAEILALLQSMIKQRRESIVLYEKGGRADLVDGETAEIAVIERFLPQQMDEAGMVEAIKAAIAATGAAGVKDMGKVMAELKAHHAGTMDFSRAGPLVKAQLGA